MRTAPSSPAWVSDASSSFAYNQPSGGMKSHSTPGMGASVSFFALHCSFIASHFGAGGGGGGGFAGGGGGGTGSCAGGQPPRRAETSTSRSQREAFMLRLVFLSARWAARLETSFLVDAIYRTVGGDEIDIAA